MSAKLFYTSVARRSDFKTHAFETRPIPRADWGSADYVVGRVRVARGALARVELMTGRMTEVVETDLIVGALGVRYATLEATGSWEDVTDDGQMDLLTGAGLIGRLTSVSLMLPPLVGLEYVGHVMRNGVQVTMRDFVPEIERVPYDRPTILLVGTSMSSGKTTAAKVIIRLLKQNGLSVVGCKVTGAARFRDILGMRDAGADAIYDFVDVGLPSSVLPPEDYRPLLADLLSMIQSETPDVVVAEAGASPLEPYNGDTVMDMLGPNAACMGLCASDPYSVSGVIQGFQRRPDFVTGVAVSTAAGVELIDKLTGLEAINVLDPGQRDRLWSILRPLVATGLT